MNRKLTKKECFIRAEVYEDCAEYLKHGCLYGMTKIKSSAFEEAAERMVETSLRVRAAKWRARGRTRE